MDKNERLNELRAAMEQIASDTDSEDIIVELIKIYDRALALQESSIALQKEIDQKLRDAEAKLITKMVAAGMTETRINGTIYTVRDINSYSVAEKNRPQLFEWLEGLGLASMIKEKYELTEEKTEFMEWLREHEKAGAIVPIDRSVHHSTLNKFFKKEWPELSESIDEKDVPEFVDHFMKTEIKKGKDKSFKNKN